MDREPDLEAVLRGLRAAPDDAWVQRCEDELFARRGGGPTLAAAATAVALALVLVVLGVFGPLRGGGLEGVRTVEAQPLCLRPALTAPPTAAAPPDRRCAPAAP